MKNNHTDCLPNEILTIIDNSYNPILITTGMFNKRNPKILYCNKAFEILFDYNFYELYEQNPLIFKSSKTEKNILKKIQINITKYSKFEISTTNYKKNKVEINLKWKITELNINEKNYYMAIPKDMKETQEEKINVELFKKYTENTVDQIAIVCLNGYFTYVNESYAKKSGYSIKELIGSKTNIVKSGKHDSKFYKSLFLKLEQNKAFDITFLNKNKSGSLYYHKQTIKPIIIDNKIYSYLIISQDITNKLKDQKYLKKLALNDQLTGLYNRNGFESLLPQITLNNYKKNNNYSFVLADIDYFKKINDTYGHYIGDLILKEFSSLIASKIRSTDYAIRWGGEEFLIILNANIENTFKIVNIIRKEIENYNFYSSLKITSSFGISQLTDVDYNNTLLIADKALYKAKREGRNRIIVLNE